MSIGEKYRALRAAMEFQILIEEGKLEDTNKRMAGMSESNPLYAFNYGSAVEIKHMIETLKGYLR